MDDENIIDQAPETTSEEVSPSNDTGNDFGIDDLKGLAEAMSNKSEGENQIASEEKEIAVEGADKQEEIVNTDENIAEKAADEKAVEAAKEVVITDEIKTQIISEKFGRDSAEIAAALTEYDVIKSDPISVLSEPEQQLLLAFRSGIDPVEHRIMQNTNFKEMSSLDVLKYEFIKNNPDLPDDLREEMFLDEIAAKYPNALNDFEPEDKSYRKDRWKMDKEAEGARARMEELKEKSKLPLPKKADVPSEQPISGKSAEDVEKAYQAHLQKVENVLTATNTQAYEVKLSEDAEPITLKLGIQKEPLKAFLENPAGWFDSQIKGADGEVDMQKLAAIGVRVIQSEAAVSEAYKAGGEAMKLRILKEKKNPAETGSLALDTDAPTLAGLGQALAKAANGKRSIQY